MKSIGKIAPLMLAAMLAQGCQHREGLQSGDLLFVGQRESAMEEAIGASTGEYTHVAIVERDSHDQLWVIEATPPEGVRRISLREWCNENPINATDTFRLCIPFDTAGVIDRAKQYIGQPYDEAFLPDNGRMYCSELVYECYGVFEQQPMNFREADGKMPKYWEEHFQRLGIPIPEGVMGTNPTSLSRSSLLMRL